MRLLSTARGRRLVVAFQPEVGQKRHPTEVERAISTAFAEVLGRVQPGVEASAVSAGYAQLRAAAGPVCARPGITCVDLADAPSLRDAPAALYADPVHLNAAGHALVADVLAPVLQSLE
jgi:lysophospholipase L1-like esterase